METIRKSRSVETARTFSILWLRHFHKLETHSSTLTHSRLKSFSLSTVLMSCLISWSKINLNVMRWSSFSIVSFKTQLILTLECYKRSKKRSECRRKTPIIRFWAGFSSLNQRKFLPQRSTVSILTRPHKALTLCPPWPAPSAFRFYRISQEWMSSPFYLLFPQSRK